MTFRDTSFIGTAIYYCSEAQYLAGIMVTKFTIIYHNYYYNFSICVECKYLLSCRANNIMVSVDYMLQR